MKTREHNWFDTKARKPMYSFQVLVDDRWCHPHENGTPCIYTTEQERDVARTKVRKLTPQPRTP